LGVVEPILELTVTAHALTVVIMEQLVTLSIVASGEFHTNADLTALPILSIAAVDESFVQFVAVVPVSLTVSAVLTSVLSVQIAVVPSLIVAGVTAVFPGVLTLLVPVDLATGAIRTQFSSSLLTVVPALSVNGVIISYLGSILVVTEALSVGTFNEKFTSSSLIEQPALTVSSDRTTFNTVGLIEQPALTVTGFSVVYNAIDLTANVTLVVSGALGETFGAVQLVVDVTLDLLGGIFYDLNIHLVVPVFLEGDTSLPEILFPLIVGTAFKDRPYYGDNVGWQAVEQGPWSQSGISVEREETGLSVTRDRSHGTGYDVTRGR
jgi:hypothetical protein